MISNQIIQTSIDELKAITKVDLCIYDITGSLVASTAEKGSLSNDFVTSFAQSPADSQVIGNEHLLKVLDEGEVVYTGGKRNLGRCLHGGENRCLPAAKSDYCV